MGRANDVDENEAVGRLLAVIKIDSMAGLVEALKIYDRFWLHLPLAETDMVRICLGVSV